MQFYANADFLSSFENDTAFYIYGIIYVNFLGN